ncbi:MAG: hypothetical protein KIS66_13600 [Fimbriimonadaceae bacterium]|nr:hypothetical protein [Fimbriimonadaceae bacterium]
MRSVAAPVQIAPICVSGATAGKMLGITHRGFVDRFVSTGMIAPLPGTGAYLVKELDDLVEKLRQQRDGELPQTVGPLAGNASRRRVKKALGLG